VEGGGDFGLGNRDRDALGRGAGTVVTAPPTLLVLALAGAPAHPLHTTLATVEWHSDHRELQVLVRVFTQDLTEAVTGTVSDSAACRYATRVLLIVDAAGRPLVPARCSTERAADVTWIRLSLLAGSPAGLRIRSAFLFERFPDQVNIVQAQLAGAARTILFTAGDGPKPLS
jgi:hypothetical protein